MKIYVDGLLFLNFFFDFLLLITTSIILKRYVPFFRSILGAFFGSLSILVLFFKIDSFLLFIIKIYLAFLMCIVTFGYKNIKTFIKTFATFYIVSIILGGFLYYFNLELSSKHVGLIFYNKKVSPNIIFLCIISPIILYTYTKHLKMYKTKILSTYKVNVLIGKETVELEGFLDTGNILKYKGKMVIITNIENRFKEKKYYVPFKSVSGMNLIECIKVKKVEVIDLGIYENIYLGFSKNVEINGSDVLLNGGMI